MRFLHLAIFAISTGALSFGQALSPDPIVPTRVRNVVYRSRVPIAFADRNRTTNWLRNYVNDPSTTLTWTDVGEFAVEYGRDLMGGLGYWQASIEAKLIPLPKKRGTLWADVVLQINEGPQYRLSGISWKGMKEFTEAELDAAMEIHEGEIASRERIGSGLERLRKLYGTRGYVNFTCFPETEFDHETHTLALRMDIDEGKQFLFGELSLPGLNEFHKKMLLDRWEGVRGSVYSHEKMIAFFRGAMWPANPKLRGNGIYLEFLELRRDERERTMNFSVHFAPPPPPLPPAKTRIRRSSGRND